MFNALQTPAPQRAGSTELTGCCVRCFRPRQQNQTDAITAWRVVVALLFNLTVKNSQKSFPSGMFVVLTFSLYLASPLVPVFFFLKQEDLTLLLTRVQPRGATFSQLLIPEF